MKVSSSISATNCVVQKSCLKVTNCHMIGLPLLKLLLTRQA